MVTFGDGDVEPAFGLFGGKDSTLNKIELRYPDGTVYQTTSKDLVENVPEGTILYQLAGGGGGYGKATLTITGALEVQSIEIDPEVVDPDDPWSYIGYWGDHQIIYLLKFLEALARHAPGTIESLLDRKPRQLSGGQQQKVMIARALAKEPKILFLDEPFSNLDPESREKIPSLISRIHEEKGLTTLIVTHDVDSMLKMCRRTIVMNDGRILADETPEKALKILETRF